MNSMQLAICAQKQKMWLDVTTAAAGACWEELHGSLRSRFKESRPFFVLGNGPVPDGKRRAVMRVLRNEQPVVVAINDHRAQSAFKRVKPRIVVVNEHTRRRDYVLDAAKSAAATAFVLVRSVRSLWREKLWQPLAPLHCVRLRADALKQLSRVASVTSGFLVLALLQNIWPTRRKYIIGFGGHGHAAAGAPQTRMWEGLVSEHLALAEILQNHSSICNLGEPLDASSQPLARHVQCPRCPAVRTRKGRAAGRFVVPCGHGQFRCKRCGNNWKAGRAPARVPECPGCHSRTRVVKNGNCFWCGSCGIAFRASLHAQFRTGPRAASSRCGR